MELPVSISVLTVPYAYRIFRGTAICPVGTNSNFSVEPRGSSRLSVSERTFAGMRGAFETVRRRASRASSIPTLRFVRENILSRNNKRIREYSQSWHHEFRSSGIVKRSFGQKVDSDIVRVDEEHRNACDLNVHHITYRIRLVSIYTGAYSHDCIFSMINKISPYVLPHSSAVSHKYVVGIWNKFPTMGHLVGPGGSGRLRRLCRQRKRRERVKAALMAHASSEEKPYFSIAYSAHGTLSRT